TEVEEDPKDLFGDNTCEVFLKVNEVYEKELEICESERNKITWPNGAIRAIVDCSRCLSCTSELLKPTKNMEGNFTLIEFECLACGEKYSWERLVEGACQTYAEEGAEITVCPHCMQISYLVIEDICASCDETKTYHNYSICDEELSTEEQDCEGMCSL